MNIVKKVKLFLCLINYELYHEDICGSGGIAPPSLVLAIDGDDWSASRSCRFTPEDITPVTHWRGGCVGSKVGMDAVE
jgi:hypothetical protein